MAEPSAAFVPPMPPDRKPASPDDRCGGCLQPLLGCWLCGRWVCQGPNSKCDRFGLPREDPFAPDAAAQSRGKSGSLSRSLLHPLPDSFGQRPGQSGAVCPSCLENCPAASTLLDEGAAYCADMFTLTHCVCGHLEFAPSMPDHMSTCSYEKRRAASQAASLAASQAASQAQSVAEPVAQQPIIGAVVGVATAFAAGSAAGPSSSDSSPPPYPGGAVSSAAGPSGSASTDSEPFVVRAPSHIADDDPMTGANDDGLVAGMDKAPDTDSQEPFHHVTHEEAAGASPLPNGTTVVAGTSELSHVSAPERQPHLPKPPPGYPPEASSHAAPPATASSKE